VSRERKIAKTFYTPPKKVPKPAVGCLRGGTKDLGRFRNANVMTFAGSQDFFIKKF